MNNNKVILTLFSKERHFPLMEFIREEFSCEVIPIIEIESSLRIFKRNRNKYHKIEHIYSFPEFYYKHSDKVFKKSDSELIKEIRSFEKEWNIETVSKYIYYDRFATRVSDYSIQIRHILLWMRFISYILETSNPLFVMRGANHTFFENVLQDALGAMKIPYLCPRDSVINERFGYTDEKNHLVGWKIAYLNLIKYPEQFINDVAKEALDWYISFSSNPVRPAYADKYSNIKPRFGPMIRDWMLAIRGILSSGIIAYYLNFNSLDRKLGFRGMPGETIIENYLKCGFRRIYQKRLSFFNSKPDLTSPFLYFPLQYVPEITTLAFGRNYQDQKNLITVLASNIPSYLRIYVKEHTSMVGRRPANFYRSLRKLYNVELISPEVSTFDLIKNSKGVVTITSTAGWEAYLLGKPVIVFGNVFYDEFKGVVKEDLTDGLAGRIERYLTSYQPDFEDIKRTVIAYFRSTYPGEIGSNLQPLPVMKDERENLKLICDSIKDQLRIREELQRLEKPTNLLNEAKNLKAV